VKGSHLPLRSSKNLSLTPLGVVDKDWREKAPGEPGEVTDDGNKAKTNHHLANAAVRLLMELVFGVVASI